VRARSRSSRNQSVAEMKHPAALRLALVATGIVAAIECAGGFLSHSLALLTGGLLFAITVFIVVEAAIRLAHPVLPQADVMAAFAAFGLIVNGTLSALLLRSTHRNLNMRAAVLHLATDALAAVGVLVAALLIWKFGWAWVD